MNYFKKIKSFLDDWFLTNLMYIVLSGPIVLFILQYLLGISNNDNIEEHSGIIEKVAWINQGSVKSGPSTYYMLFMLQGDDKLYGQYYSYVFAFSYKKTLKRIHIEPGDKLTFYIDKNDDEIYYNSKKFIVVLNEFYDRIRGKTYNDENIHIIKTTGIVLNGHTEINYKDRKYLTFGIQSIRFVAYFWFIFNIMVLIAHLSMVKERRQKFQNNES